MFPLKAIEFLLKIRRAPRSASKNFDPAAVSSTHARAGKKRLYRFPLEKVVSTLQPITAN
jgi:hypothetical protein